MQATQTEATSHQAFGSMAEFLNYVIARPELHCRWLNTLSFMEHTGTRKIHRTQSGVGMTDAILQHASEEARHALYYKRMIDKVIPGRCPDYNPESMLVAWSCFRYFQSLDATVNRELLRSDADGAASSRRKMRPGSAHALRVYLYVTTLIEERAGWLFGLYEAALRQADSPISISSIIAEEENHLRVMDAELGRVDSASGEWMERFRKSEALLFHRLEKSLFAAVRAEG